jgi:hypothetical protein
MSSGTPPALHRVEPLLRPRHDRCARPACAHCGIADLDGVASRSTVEPASGTVTATATRPVDRGDIAAAAAEFGLTSGIVVEEHANSRDR